MGRQVFGALAVAFGAMVVVGLGAGDAKAQSRSTFQDSCSEIRYATDDVGTPAIAATCLRADGVTQNQSMVAIRGISNNEGRLVGGPGVSSFQTSCRRMRVEVQGEHVVLLASCYRSNGQRVDASARLYDIENNDGNLRHRVAGNDTLVTSGGGRPRESF